MGKKRNIFIFSGIIVVIAVLGIVAYINGKTSQVGGDFSDEMQVLVQKVKKEELSETVLVTGKVVPEDEQKIHMDMEHGEIKEFRVEENDVVEAGQALFIYDTSKIDAEFNSAVRARDLVQNRVKTEESQIVQLNKQIEQAKKNNGNLQQSNQDSEEEVIGTFVTHDEINQLENEKAHLQLELENTKAEVAAMQDEINEIDKRKKEMTVKSKIDGIVVKVNKNIEKTEGGSTEPVVHIVSNEPFKVIGSMSEFDTVKIKPEQEVLVRPKVFKDREWKGLVESVSQFPSDDEGMGDDFYAGDGNVTMYPFKVTITDDTKELRQGFHVSLEVKTSGKKALVVPHMAVFDDMLFMSDMSDEDMMFFEDEAFDMGNGPSYVFALVDGIIEMREVETGEMNDEFIEITDGVSLDEQVVITPHEGMYDGMEVDSYDEVE